MDPAPDRRDALPDLSPPTGVAAPALLDFGDLGDLPLTVEITLGTVPTDLGGLLSMKVGSVLRAGRRKGELLEITVNGTPVAKGEACIHGERFAVRVTEILRASPDHNAEGTLPDLGAPISPG